MSSASMVTAMSRLRTWMDRYRGWALGVFAVIATVTLIVAQIVPEVQTFLVRRAIIPYLILFIVLDIALTIEGRASAGTRLVRDQDEAIPLLEAAATKCRESGADLLEYAGLTILPLVRVLHREGVPVRILVQHPELAEGFQLQRHMSTLDTIYNSIFRTPSTGVEVRCYRAPYSIRGRRLGDELLDIGWLTPDIPRKTTHGHDNPSFLADLRNAENHVLRALFDRTFEDLWTDPQTEDGRAVLERLRADGLAPTGAAPID